MVKKMARTTLRLKKPIQNVELDIDENSLVANGFRKIVHGNWIDDENMDECKCSVCGTMYNWFDNAFLHEANYCPYCGAYMREVKE